MKKLFSFSGRTMALLLLLLLGSRLYGQQVEGIAGVDFVADERIFDVMCAIHAAGYDYRLAQADPASPRAKILTQVDSSAAGQDLLGQMREFFRRNNVEMNMMRQQSKYAALTLLLSPPPAFTYQEQESQPASDVSALAPFASMVALYRARTNLYDVWAAWQPEILRFLDTLKGDFRSCIQGLYRFSKMNPSLRLSNRLVVIPDFVDAPNTFLTIQTGTRYFVFVSPAPDIQRYRKYFIHQYTHLVFDPLFDAGARRLDDDHDLASFLQGLPEYAHLAAEPSLAVRESLYNAVGLMVMAGLGAPALDAERRNIIRRDSPFLLYFEEKLKTFQSGGETLAEWLTAFLKNPDVEAMTASYQAPAAGAGASAAANPPPPAQDPGMARIDKLLLVEGLLKEGKVAEAEAEVERMVAKDPGDAEAQFLRGLCLYARDRHADALAVFDRVLDLPSATLWVKGWALVRSGNCLLILDRKEEALRRYREAAALGEGDRGAHEAARTILDKLGSETGK